MNISDKISTSKKDHYYNGAESVDLNGQNYLPTFDSRESSSRYGKIPQYGTIIDYDTRNFNNNSSILNSYSNQKQIP